MRASSMKVGSSAPQETSLEPCRKRSTSKSKFLPSGRVSVIGVLATLLVAMAFRLGRDLVFRRPDRKFTTVSALEIHPSQSLVLVSLVQ